MSTSVSNSMAGHARLGKIALVTGASSGKGRAAALELASRGAQVVVSARRAEALEALVAEITAQGGAAQALPCDVTDGAQIRALLAFTQRQHGRLDIAFNNAGTEGQLALTSIQRFFSQ
jgi:NAD(P)-dependent dehydrogenase (short-subunit alcohol dehydrogenase family)